MGGCGRPSVGKLDCRGGRLGCWMWDGASEGCEMLQEEACVTDLRPTRASDEDRRDEVDEVSDGFA